MLHPNTIAIKAFSDKKSNNHAKFRSQHLSDSSTSNLLQNQQQSSAAITECNQIKKAFNPKKPKYKIQIKIKFFILHIRQQTALRL